MKDPLDPLGQAAQEISDTVLTMMREIHDAFEPEWASRRDVLKTIISLSSGSIILTVAFSDSIRLAAVNPIWRRIVLVGFVSLMLALVFAFIAFWIGSAVYELQSSALTQEPKFQQAIKSATSRDEATKNFLAAFDERFAPIAKRDRYAIFLYRASGICYCVGICILAAVGIKRLTS